LYEDDPNGSPRCCGSSMIKAVTDFTWTVQEAGLQKRPASAPDVVNAINDEHRELIRRLATERDAWNQMDAPTDANCTEIRNRLLELRKDLARHFNGEETGGYLAHVLEASPCLGRQVDKLQRQHADFLMRLDALGDMLKPGQSENWKDARAHFGRLVVEMRGHEAAETALARLAFSDEVMTVDEKVRG
ncbi:MAG: hemerythrin domain-containing protein, partial [Thermomicrobiales bacterium]